MASTNKLKQTVAHAQPMRKFYPAPYISEQTINETPRTIPPSVSDSELTGYGSHTIHDSVLHKRAIGRELGMNESLYFRQALKGADVISLMMQVESTVPITEVAVRHAINKLMERHPLLRVTVGSHDDSYFMHEGTSRDYDFTVSPRADWTNVIKEEIDQPFKEDGGLLWRIRLLNSSRIGRSREGHGSGKVQSTMSHASSLSSHTYRSDTPTTEHQHTRDDVDCNGEFDYQATFLFIFNHAITDGGYTMWLFQEFINFIDAYNMGVDIDRIRQIPLLPPSEICLTSLNKRDDVGLLDVYASTGSSVRLCKELGNPSMLNMYTHKFRDEIRALSAIPPRNNFIWCRFSKAVTGIFTNACKSHGVKVDTALVTASLLALIDLLYTPGEDHGQYEIPFEYMSDTRRTGHYQFEGSDKFPYPGLASIGMPLKALIRLDQQPATTAAFWDLTKLFDKPISSDIQAIETIQLCYQLARTNAQTYESKGKSPFVLCFSNMGKLDRLFNEDVSTRFRLVDLLGQSSILKDDMPLFFVNTFALNGQLFGSVNFCDGFTSVSTATLYLNLFEKYITTHSKL